MEEGISKGFIRSSEQVAKNLTTLAAMTNNNPLWEGEHGARRLSEINAGFEGATELQDSNDVLAFRAARNLLGKDAPYYEVMEYLENPENQMALYEEFKKLAAEAEGGDIGAITERLRKRFGWNYTTTGQLLRGETKTDTEIKALMGKQPGLPSPDSPELEWAKMSVQTANVQIRAGQVTFDTVLGEMESAYALDNAPIPEGIMSREDMSRAEGIPISSVHELIPRIRNSPDSVYSNFFGKDENELVDKIDRMNLSAISRNNEDELNAAYSAFYKLSEIQKEKGTSKSWNERNVLNEAVVNSTNMLQFLAKLDELIEIERRNGEVNVIVE